jgi:hypothetical protein
LSFLPLEYIANPIVPKDNPATDAPQEKKFKKKVDSNTWITIKKGRIMPRNIRIMPRLRRRRGEFMIYLRAERNERTLMKSKRMFESSIDFHC